MSLDRVVWPDGKRFAFTVFDDPDSQPLAVSERVYGFLADRGLRTTIGTWTIEPGEARRNSPGETCANPDYLAWLLGMQRNGFEVGFHHVAPANMAREEIRRGLDIFTELFGHDPVTMANHYNSDALYWGANRLNGWARVAYQVATRGSTANRFFGEQIGHASFWGDLAQERVRYCRNFVFRDLNTLKACPLMPYHDPDRPFVNQWYASSEASNISRFKETVTEETIDTLEEEGGASILYTHFGHGYVAGKSLDSRFSTLINRVSRKNGWFVPVQTLLRYLEDQGNGLPIARSVRDSLARRWLLAKLRYGTS